VTQITNKAESTIALDFICNPLHLPKGECQFSSPWGGREGVVYPRQLVVPSVVAIAVRRLIRI
jgi:hypothetical protein